MIYQEHHIEAQEYPPAHAKRRTYYNTNPQQNGKPALPTGVNNMSPRHRKTHAKKDPMRTPCTMSQRNHQTKRSAKHNGYVPVPIQGRRDGYTISQRTGTQNQTLDQSHPHKWTKRHKPHYRQIQGERHATSRPHHPCMRPPPPPPHPTTGTGQPQCHTNGKNGNQGAAPGGLPHMHGPACRHKPKLRPQTQAVSNMCQRPPLLRCPLCRRTLVPCIASPPLDDPTYEYVNIQQPTTRVREL